MIKILYITIVLSTIFTTSHANISSTPHNLAGISSATNNSKVCLYCHPPISSEPTQTPLWSQTQSDSEFSMYVDAYQANRNSLSMLCLSCHDGASSKNSIVDILDEKGSTLKSTNIDTNPVYMKTSRNLTLTGSYGDLNDDHPVSIDYIPGKAGLKSKSEMLLGQWKGATTVEDLLINGKVECTSCHDPHFNDSKGIFLRNENHNSQLCFSCHGM